MQATGKDLQRTVDAFYLKYKDIDDKTASLKPAPNEWSLKEIIGHLINSASNNQQRFLGLQFVKEMQFPPYQKYHLQWLEREKFNELKFEDLFSLWRQYNVLNAHIIGNIDAVALDNIVEMEDGRKIPLEAVAADYVKHLKIHLTQFGETLSKISQ
ncbi:MAG: DinB family protein [Dehalococcoidia bacterium]|nr:DinB family protein [Dehalococcoidia bacterium]